jgi:hypothetical protein
MKKGMIALIGMFVALVFIVVAFFGPWYTMNVNSSISGAEMDYNVGMFLTKMEMKGMGQDVSISYADAKSQAAATGVNTDSFKIIDYTMYLTMGAIITAILALIGILGFVFNFGNANKMRMLGVIFGVIAFILAIAAPLYFMTTSFTQGNYGFWFSQTITGMNVSGGPGFAWYLMIVAAIIALVASIAMLLKKSVPEAVMPVPPTQ